MMDGSSGDLTTEQRLVLAEAVARYHCARADDAEAERDKLRGALPSPLVPLDWKPTKENPE